MRIKFLNFIIIRKDLHSDFESTTFHVEDVVFFVIRPKTGSLVHLKFNLKEKRNLIVESSGKILESLA
jgi:hypothetical protein